MFGGTFAQDPHNELVRAKLVATLYTNPSSLLIGALCGIAAGLTAFFSTRDDIVGACAVALVVIGIWRIALAYYIPHSRKQRDARRLELLYEAGAFSWSFFSGIVAARTIVIGAEEHVQSLLIAYALSYGTGIAARNAGRPLIAFGQLLLTVVPVLVACFTVATLPLVVLGVSAFFMVVALFSIILNVFATFREQITAALASARMAEQMRTLARTDVVTGLLNRAGLNEDLQQAVTELPADRKLALFWLDLDKFKEINDTLGHPVGDEVLTQVAARLADAAPKGAIVARFGGDEFVVATQVEGRAQSKRVATSLSKAAAGPIRIRDDSIDCSTSIGVAMIPEDGADVEALMQGADLALYDAKAAGRGQVRFFHSAMTSKLVRRREIERELRAAIQRDELSVFFQPIVDLETGRIRSFEALVRWFHPEKGELLPGEFIPVAEESGLIITMGNWITKQAARACASWPEDVTIAVNLSPVQIRAPGAALGILTALHQAGLAPSRLELEVTESVLLDDNANTNRFIEELSSAGVRFALDDFGTGYSSLHYINRFPFRKIKIDRSFVSGPNAGAKSCAIIHAVAGMGTMLGMEIVAEGIETMDQVQAVRHAGCTLGQGFYFSRAVPDHRATMLLDERCAWAVPSRMAS